MRPHEETWEHVSGAWPHDVVRAGTSEKIADVWATGQEDGNGAADLIAQAPAMARLLLRLQWEGGGTGYEGELCCPACGADAPQTIHIPARRIDAYTRTEARDEIVRGEHEDNCYLVATLRAAGVIE